jgi:hypothetical protein
MSDDPRKNRAQAAALVLEILRSPMSLMSIPMREEAKTLAEMHDLSAVDLIDVAVKKARAM